MPWLRTRALTPHCLLQPQVQQLLHGVGRGLRELWAAGPDQPHGPCHWLSGGLGHWPNDLYSQWQREQHLFPGKSRSLPLSNSIFMSQYPETTLQETPGSQTLERQDKNNNQSSTQARAGRLLGDCLVEPLIEIRPRNEETENILELRQRSIFSIMLGATSHLLFTNGGPEF